MLFIFDILYLNGRSLLPRTLRQRREVMHQTFAELPGRVQFADHIISTDEKELKGEC